MEEKIRLKLQKWILTGKDTLTSSDYKYIECHRYLINSLLEQKIQIESIDGEFLKTELGTFWMNDKETIEILNKKLQDTKEISVIEFFKYITAGKWKGSTMKASWIGMWDGTNDFYRKNFDCYLNQIINSIRDLVDIKNKDIEAVKKNMVRDISCNVGNPFIGFPIEFLNEENFTFAINNEKMYNYLKQLMEMGYTFDKNKRLMFSMIVHFDLDSKYIADNYDEFLQYLFKYKAVMSPVHDKNSFVSYLLKNFHVSDTTLMKLYKNDPLLCKYFDIFKLVALEIENKSPLIPLDESGKEVHVRYHQYDLYDGVPVREKISSSVRSADSFEQRFLVENTLVAKLYKKYYKSYMKQNGKGNLKNFIASILFNFNNFQNVINDDEFTVANVESLRCFIYCFDENLRVKFDENYKKYMQSMKQYYFNIYNNIIKNKDEPEILGKILNNAGFTVQNAYSKILNNKFLDQKMKTALLQIVGVYYGDAIQVIDIINILDEMLDRKITLDEILKEKNIEKNAFKKIYEESTLDNPILYEYIKDTLSKNKRRGYAKCIKLGYLILNSDIGSYEEYNSKFPKYDLFSLLESLKQTELYKKLNEKIKNWEDLDIESYSMGKALPSNP